ncbi:Hpt domain-containing protein [Ferrimonas balearica]|uniref:Hpt domain-containing protein n=1 Tax=Ferrimonas balearica TaxID=44012 RepID=UPI001C98EBBE|nr:Hpt domain-containing protein [Ferrimonas balearica]MBY5920659.1 Hpt domain-containing protein [Ferrimonas balearica]MBY5996656.1 Hpt domain-containing protein [Ferrimonas balearica]
MVGRVNVDYFFKEVCDSDFDFMLQTINAFEEYSLSILSSLREQSEKNQKDSGQAIRLIHMACGSIGLLGFTDYANQLSQIENQLRDEQLRYDEARHNQVCKTIREVNAELDQCLAAIKFSKDKR